MTKSDFNNLKLAAGDIVTLKDKSTHKLTGVDWSRNEVEIGSKWVQIENIETIEVAE